MSSGLRGGSSRDLWKIEEVHVLAQGLSGELPEGGGPIPVTHVHLMTWSNILNTWLRRENQMLDKYVSHDSIHLEPYFLVSVCET